MAITFQILDLNAFRQANSSNQIKELYTVYGLNTALLSSMDTFFINQLWIKKSEFDTHLTGVRISEEQHKKFYDHYIGKATLGMLINDFTAAYDTTGFDEFFSEIKRVRNLLAHRYDVFSTKMIEDESERNTAYKVLLDIYYMVEDLKRLLLGRPFRLLSNPNFVVKWVN